MLLGKEQILGAADLPHEDVNIELWGGPVRITTMMGTDRELFERRMASKGDNRENMRAELLAMTIVDESGKRIFEPEDVDALGKKSGAILDQLFDVAQRLNGFGAVARKEAEKN